uniref:Putative bovine pancreatic trypsin inhibitor n=1 Tax=Rhipicephalus microplus TaxID=6941 RepID=A0A6G5A622_RHIMP
MRLLQYLILAGFLICILADYEGEQNQDRPGFRKKRGQKPALRGRPNSRRNPVTNNEVSQRRQLQRCTFKLHPTNCAASFFVQRWAYNADNNTCEPINFPVCWEKSGMFLSCAFCMNMCLKKHKDGPEKKKWIHQHCKKSMTKHLEKHSLN